MSDSLKKVLNCGQRMPVTLSAQFSTRFLTSAYLHFAKFASDPCSRFILFMDSLEHLT